MPFPYLTLMASTFIICAFSARPAAAYPLFSGATREGKSVVENIAVYPHDSRKELYDKKAPWGAIGSLRLPDQTSCTASLIGPNLILTNSHCVADEKNKRIMQGKYVFRAQYRRGRARLVSEVKEIYAGGFRISHNDRNGDWAVLVLKKRLGDTLGWFGVTDYESSDLLKITDHYKLYMAGYANDFAKAEVPSWQGNCSFHDTYFGKDSILTHDCSSTAGASGSPMFIFVEKDDGKKEARIVAIHSGNQFASNKNISEKGEMVAFSETTANLAVHSSAFIETVRKLRAEHD